MHVYNNSFNFLYPLFLSIELEESDLGSTSFFFWRSVQFLMLKSVPSVLVLAQSALEKLLFLCTRIDLTARHLSVSPITSEHDSDSQCTEPLWSEFPSFFQKLWDIFAFYNLWNEGSIYFYSCQLPKIWQLIKHLVHVS